MKHITLALVCSAFASCATTTLAPSPGTCDDRVGYNWNYRTHECEARDCGMHISRESCVRGTGCAWTYECATIQNAHCITASESLHERLGNVRDR